MFIVLIYILYIQELQIKIVINIKVYASILLYIHRHKYIKAHVYGFVPKIQLLLFTFLKG